MRKILALFVILVLSSALVGPGCAEGEPEGDGVDQTETDSDAGYVDAEDETPDDAADRTDTNGDDPCDDVDCSSTEVCDPDGPECVECLDADDCDGDDVCDGDVCVECIDGEDCDDTLVCDTDDHTCVPCVDDGDCSNDLVCDDEIPACVGCTGDDDCADDHVCDDEICVECIEDQHCDGACDTDDQLCVECTDDQHCDGACDTDDQLCVECTDNQHCDDLFCDDADHTCVECVEDKHCDDGPCHPDFAACAPSCCDFTADLLDENHRPAYYGFDVAADDKGRPVIAITDRNNDEVIVASRDDGGWTYETVDQLDDGIDSTPFLRMALDDDDQPHIVFTADGTDELMYYWRENGDWHSDLLHDDGDAGRLDIAFGDDGTAHVVIDGGAGDERLHYYWRESDGTTGDEPLYAADDETLQFVDLFVDADGQIAMATSGFSAPLYVYNRDTAGNWSHEKIYDEEDEIGTNNGAYPSIVGDDENLWVTAEVDDGLILWEDTIGGWEEALVINNPDKGKEPDMAIDADGRPHIAHHGLDVVGDRRVFYLRPDGDSWNEYDAEDFEGYGDIRFALDNWQRPHIVGRDFGEPLLYLTTDW